MDVAEISSARRRIASIGRSAAVASAKPPSDARTSASGPPMRNAARRLDRVSARFSRVAPTTSTRPSTRNREEPRGLVEPRHGRTVREHGPLACARELGRREERRAVQRPGGVEHAAVWVHDLGERLAPLDERARRRRNGAAVGHERGEILRARAEALVERALEVGRDMAVREPPGGAEERGHREREGERQSEPDREPAHEPPSSRSRYPAPRTVSIDCVPNGRSTFTRRYRTYTSTTFERFS